jgi:hypothetical protein
VASNGVLAPIGDVIAATNPSGSINLELGMSTTKNSTTRSTQAPARSGVFSIQPNGALQEEASISGIPKNAGVEGLAAF